MAIWRSAFLGSRCRYFWPPTSRRARFPFGPFPANTTERCIHSSTGATVSPLVQPLREAESRLSNQPRPCKLPLPAPSPGSLPRGQRDRKRLDSGQQDWCRDWIVVRLSVKAPPLPSSAALCRPPGPKSHATSTIVGSLMAAPHTHCPPGNHSWDCFLSSHPSARLRLSIHDRVHCSTVVPCSPSPSPSTPAVDIRTTVRSSCPSLLLLATYPIRHQPTLSPRLLPLATSLSGRPRLPGTSPLCHFGPMLTTRLTAQPCGTISGPRRAPTALLVKSTVAQ